MAQTESEEDLRRYREDRKRLYPKLRKSDQHGEVQGADLLTEEERARRKELLQSILAAQKAMGLQRAAGTMALEVRNVGGFKSSRSEKFGRNAEGKEATDHIPPIQGAHSERTRVDRSRRSSEELQDRGMKDGHHQKGLEALQSYEDSEEESSQLTHRSICDEKMCKGGMLEPLSERIIDEAFDFKAPAVDVSNTYGSNGPARQKQKRKKRRSVPEEHVPKKTLLQKLFS